MNSYECFPASQNGYMNNNKYFAGPVEAWCASGYAWVSLECGYFQSEKAKTYSLLMSAYASCLDALKKYPHITKSRGPRPPACEVT